MEDVKLHLVMLPCLAFGHLIPFLELSKWLARRGHRISFISTPRNIERLAKIPPNLSLLINLVKLTPPPIDGLPADAQATIDVPIDDVPYIEKLQDGLEEPTRRFLKELSPSPDWIIHDLYVHWAPHIANEFGLKSAFFSVLSTRALCFFGPPSALVEGTMFGSPEKMTMPQPWLTIPSDRAFRYHEAIRTSRARDHGDSNVSKGHRFATSIHGSNLLAIRSSPEFEPEWMGQLAGFYCKPILPIGFLPPVLEDSGSSSSHIWEDGHWLDTQKQGSTVYVAFGSELRLTQEEVSELAFGLEQSGLPFVWAYRGDPALLPTGFKDQAQGRGLVQMGWAPQPKFLAHPSIGGFLMHGGWGSAIEALAFGKPLILLPMINDQGMNSRFLDGKKVGVELPRNEMDGYFTRDAVAKTLKLVMVEAEGETIRVNAREMKNMISDRVSQDRYIDEFAQYLIQHRCA